MTIKRENIRLANARRKLSVQKEKIGKLSAELTIARKELAFQKKEKGKRAHELGIANVELAFQDKEKGKRAEELGIANVELAFQKNEKKIRANELRIANYARSLIEASRDPLFTINPKGKITDINQATIDATGVTRKILIGSNFFKFFTEPKKAREVYKQVFSKGFVADYPLTIIDGKLTSVLFNGSVYKDDDGNV